MKFDVKNNIFKMNLYMMEKKNINFKNDLKELFLLYNKNAVVKLRSSNTRKYYF